MTYEEVINLLREIRQDSYRTDYAQAIDIAIDAVERRMPKTPIIEPYEPAYCPNCDSILSESLGDDYFRHYKHLDMCPNCGQAIDWGNIDEW